MSGQTQPEPPPQADLLRLIMAGTAGETGLAFFRALVKNLSLALDTCGCWVTEYLPEGKRLRALAFWMDGGFVDSYEYDIAGTPCEPVVEECRLAHFPKNIVSIFPNDPDLQTFDAVSYIGTPLQDTSGQILGHLAVIDRKPMPNAPHLYPVLEIFGARAAAEMQRLARERTLHVLQEEADYLRELNRAAGLGEMMGQSPAMKELFAAIRQVAGTDTTVLVEGETGTGKELIAHSIHQASPRADRPLIRVNCAAIPGSLIESEFFGHEKGAFTGATARREGRFKLADGGTIFLDEVGELPLDLQAKLLRVLQEGELEPLGSSTTIEVDVRVIAATNRDLKAMVEEGGFREDLYYRLNVFPVRVPPLRERGDDIVLLAGAFAERLATRLGRTVRPLGSAEASLLRGYDWPGNVRELQNVIERALILAKEDRLALAEAMPGPPRVAAVEAMMDEDPDRVLTADEWRNLERRNLRRALEQSEWKISGTHGAAARLDIPPSTLASRMKALGIKRPSR